MGDPGFYWLLYTFMVDDSELRPSSRVVLDEWFKACELELQRDWPHLMPRSLPRLPGATEMELKRKQR